MSIPKDIILLIGAIVIAVIFAGAVPLATNSSLDASPEQRTSHVIWRSGTARGSTGGVIDEMHREARTDLSMPPAVVDTLRHSVRGGDVLIIDLPERLDGQPVGSYSLLRAPALSWLVDYSFMWRTLPQDNGRHHVLIHADGLADTLVVAIQVE